MGGEKRKQPIERGLVVGQCASFIGTTRDDCRVQPALFKYARCQLVVKVVGGIGKGSEDKHLLVFPIDGV